MDLSFLESYRGRRVLVTGDTGFKGAWLCCWLRALGADVYGMALPAPTEPSLFGLCGLADVVQHHDVDVRDDSAVEKAFEACDPEMVFHLAAQPLVVSSYSNPKETFDTNVGGLVNLLEQVRRSDRVSATVVVTSDKCYENREWHLGYRENDAMGGHDPYSASKGCAELVTAAYRRSFAAVGGLASARAGNVIGGGDWADYRLVPDCVRSLARGEPIVLRNPRALRPWQHVLDPLLGYLLLMARLVANPKRFSQGFNFGPQGDEPVDVEQLANMFVQAWGQGEVRIEQNADQPHEAHLLRLSCEKAASLLGWRGVLSERQAVEWSARWYQRWHQPQGESLRAFTAAQIDAFCALAKTA
jgi:CDP-glucose 4,6-dehydratase